MAFFACLFRVIAVMELVPLHGGPENRFWPGARPDQKIMVIV
jgi:hypothetical protein